MQNEPLDRRSHAEWLLSQNADVALWLERRLKGFGYPSRHPQEHYTDMYLTSVLSTNTTAARAFFTLGKVLLSNPCQDPLMLLTWVEALNQTKSSTAFLSEYLFLGDVLAPSFVKLALEYPEMEPHPLNMLLMVWAKGQDRDERIEHLLRDLMHPIGTVDPTLACFSASVMLIPRRVGSEEAQLLIQSWQRSRNKYIPMAVRTVVQEQIPGFEHLLSLSETFG